MTKLFPTISGDHRATLPGTVSLIGLGTAVPEHRLPQDMVKNLVADVFGDRYPDFDRLSKSFTTSGIRQRYSVVPPEWFEQEKSWPERNTAYLEGATELFIMATKAALKDSGLEAQDIDVVVTVSSTGVATPTLEARALSTLSFRKDIKRVPVFGLGCAGGVTGLSLATRLARAMPGQNILLVAVETCTLSFRADRLKKADIIATVLFGDGAAAAVVNSDIAGGPTLGDGYEHTWPDTLPIMGWDVDAAGLGVVFDRSIPAFVNDHMAEAVLAAYHEAGFSPDDVRRLICHPGGAKVLDAIEASFGLQSGFLKHERTVLENFGNMSAPTVLFVLQEVMRHNPQGQMMLAALGPGFTASMLPIKF